MATLEETSYFWTTAQAVIEQAFIDNKITVKVRDSELEVESLSFDWQGKITLTLKT